MFDVHRGDTLSCGLLVCDTV